MVLGLFSSLLDRACDPSASEFCISARTLGTGLALGITRLGERVGVSDIEMRFFLLSPKRDGSDTRTSPFDEDDIVPQNAVNSLGRAVAFICQMICAVFHY